MGRARSRDFFDVAALLDRFGPDRLLGLAATKDAGFSVETFLDALRAIGRLTLADWAEDGISEQDAQRLRNVFNAWRAQLGSSG